VFLYALVFEPMLGLSREVVMDKWYKDGDDWASGDYRVEKIDSDADKGYGWYVVAPFDGGYYDVLADAKAACADYEAAQGAGPKRPVTISPPVPGKTMYALRVPTVA
jgi:hypothetical protein